MTSVTKDKKKYGNPTVYDDKRINKQREEIIEKDLEDQLNRDLNNGRLEYGRRLPIIEDYQK